MRSLQRVFGMPQLKIAEGHGMDFKFISFNTDIVFTTLEHISVHALLLPVNPKPLQLAKVLRLRYDVHYISNVSTVSSHLEVCNGSVVSDIH